MTASEGPGVHRGLVGVSFELRDEQPVTVSGAHLDEGAVGGERMEPIGCAVEVELPVRPSRDPSHAVANDDLTIGSAVDPLVDEGGRGTEMLSERWGLGGQDAEDEPPV